MGTFSAPREVPLPGVPLSGRLLEQPHNSGAFRDSDTLVGLARLPFGRRCGALSVVGPQALDERHALAL